MKFLYPNFLFALLTIAIPIIIHLFSFRRYKTVYFSNVGFLKEVKKESQKKSRLKQLLILLARIFTIIFLVFAFAKPYLPVGTDTPKQPGQLVAVYIDNSFSMNALSEQGQLLEIARNKALEISMAYPPGTKFRLFTNDLEPKHRNPMNREQFIRQVSAVQSSAVVLPLSVPFNRLAAEQDPLNGQMDKTLYVISDFQRISADFENIQDKNLSCYFLPLTPNETANLFIDSCWTEVPAHGLKQEEEIFVRIRNSSNQDLQNLPLNLYINDSLKSITGFSVSANSQITASLKYTNHTSGLQLGKIEISDYPFTFDNQWFISYQVAPKLKALAIYNNTEASRQGLQYLSALFKNDDYIQLDEVSFNSIQVSRLKEYNTVFLVNPGNFSSGFLNEIQNSVQNGLSVVLFPGSENEPATSNEILSLFNAEKITGVDSTEQKISEIDPGNKFYRDVFRKREENAVFPVIKNHFRFEKPVRSAENMLLRFQNGDKALSVLNSGRGKLWVFAFPLNRQNESFARDVLFVPTIYNIVLNSLPTQEMSFTIGENTSCEIPAGNNLNLNSAIEIENKSTGERFIPSKRIAVSGIRIDFGGQVREAGHYFIMNDNAAVSALAFNYNRRESDLRYFSASGLKEKTATAGLKNAVIISDVERNFSEVLSDLQNGRPLWRIALLLSLLFMVAEVLISRLMKG